MYKYTALEYSLVLSDETSDFPTANEMLKPEQRHPLPSYRDYVSNSSVRAYQSAYFSSRCPQDANAAQVTSDTQRSRVETSSSLHFKYIYFKSIGVNFHRGKSIKTCFIKKRSHNNELECVY